MRQPSHHSSEWQEPEAAKHNPSNSIGGGPPLQKSRSRLNGPRYVG